MSYGDRSAGARTACLRLRCTAPCCLNKCNWAYYPALQDVDFACHSITDVSSIQFCNNSVISENGASLQLTASNNITLHHTDPSGTITVDTPPYVSATSVSSSSQLIPRVYLDNLINIALPAIAGYMPGTCYNLNKNITKSAGNLTSVVGDGNLYFLYPFIDTPIANVVTYTGGSGLITTATSVGLSLIEYANLTDLSGICVATTGNVAATIWRTANTRYTTPLTPAYTLRAGKKYAVSTIHNNATQVQSLGFGMGGASYSIGVLPYDVQTSATYTDGIPVVGQTIGMNPTGSGFVILVGLVP